MCRSNWSISRQFESACQTNEEKETENIGSCGRCVYLFADCLYLLSLLYWIRQIWSGSSSNITECNWVKKTSDKWKAIIGCRMKIDSKCFGDGISALWICVRLYVASVYSYSKCVRDETNTEKKPFWIWECLLTSVARNSFIGNVIFLKLALIFILEKEANVLPCEFTVWHWFARIQLFIFLLCILISRRSSDFVEIAILCLDFNFQVSRFFARAPLCVDVPMFTATANDLHKIYLYIWMRMYASSGSV